MEYRFKHLKHFSLFEKVIVPKQLEKPSYEIQKFEDLVRYGNENDFDVVSYDEFYSTLPEADKKTAPPKSTSCPFFALFHPITKKPMFVLSDNRVVRMPGFINIVISIIRHEFIHGEQNFNRNGLTFDLPNPLDKRGYFSNKDEIMAFAWTIADALVSHSFVEISSTKYIEEGLKRLRSTEMGRLWEEIVHYTKSRPKIYQRYMKYIYLYVEQMLVDKNLDPDTE